MEIEYYNSSNQPLKIKKRLRLQKQVALACLGTYLFLVVNFLMGIYSEAIAANFLNAQYSYYKSDTEFETKVFTDQGNFRSTLKNFKYFEDVPMLKLWQTPIYKTIIKAQIIRTGEEAFWCPVNIYMVFSFFPILGLIGAILCLLVKNEMAARYGFQLSIFSAIMLVFSCLMLGMA